MFRPVKPEPLDLDAHNRQICPASPIVILPHGEKEEKKSKRRRRSRDPTRCPALLSLGSPLPLLVAGARSLTAANEPKHHPPSPPTPKQKMAVPAKSKDGGGNF